MFEESITVNALLAQVLLLVFVQVRLLVQVFVKVLVLLLLLAQVWVLVQVQVLLLVWVLVLFLILLLLLGQILVNVKYTMQHVNAHVKECVWSAVDLWIMCEQLLNPKVAHT